VVLLALESEQERVDLLLWTMKEIALSIGSVEFISDWGGEWPEVWLNQHLIKADRHAAILLSINNLIKGVEEDISIKTGIKRLLQFLENPKEEVVAGLLLGMFLYCSFLPFTQQWEVDHLLVEDSLYELENRYHDRLKIMDHIAEVTGESEALRDVLFARMAEEFACPQDWQALLIYWAETRSSYAAVRWYEEELVEFEEDEDDEEYE
jgi:hypothetical protein